MLDFARPCGGWRPLSPFSWQLIMLRTDLTQLSFTSALEAVHGVKRNVRLLRRVLPALLRVIPQVQLYPHYSLCFSCKKRFLSLGPPGLSSKAKTSFGSKSTPTAALTGEP